MESAVADPVMRAQLTPTYDLGCKRVLPSNDFYPAIARPNVSLVTEKIIEFRPDAVVTADGAEHNVDTVILATGFRVTDNPMFGRIAGDGGQTLAEAFGRTYLGTVVPGFPNYFQLTGANTGLGHSSMLFMIESQLNYIVDGIAKAEAAGGQFEVRPEVAAGLQRRAPAQATEDGLGLRLLQLVPGQRGPQPHALAGLHLRLPPPHPRVRRRRLRARLAGLKCGRPLSPPASTVAACNDSLGRSPSSPARRGGPASG